MTNICFLYSDALLTLFNPFMHKSFYSRDFELAFSFHEKDTVFGILKAKQMGMNVPEFTGLYNRHGPVIDVSFFIDWKLSNPDFIAFSAFSGTIEPVKEGEILKLNWIFIADSAFQTNVLSAGTTILKSSFQDGQFHLDSGTGCPFPNAGVLTSME